MKSLVCFEDSRLPYCCGITDVGAFELYDQLKEKPTFNKEKPWEYIGYAVKPTHWDRSNTEETKRQYEYDLEDWEEDACNAQVTLEPSGTGLFVASFVDSEECRAAYKYLCENHTLLFQTNPRTNKGSGNPVFLCVFQHERSRKVPKLEPKVTEPTTPRFPIRKGEKLPRL